MRTRDNPTNCNKRTERGCHLEHDGEHNNYLFDITITLV